MYKIAIVEDEQNAANKLAEYLEKYADQYNIPISIDAFGDAMDFIDHYRPTYDIVFMDIEMPFMNGMDAARQLRQLDQQVVLIFVTNMVQYASKGYEVDALDYIIKPLRYGDFERRMKKAVTRRDNDSQTIMVTHQSGVRRFLLREIRYIEVMGHKLLFHTESGVYNGSGTLLEVEETLKKHGFLRCKNCYLVNTKHIMAVEGLTLLLSDGSKLSISRLRKKIFMSEMAENIGNENVI